MRTPDFSTATWHKSRRSGDNGGQCVEVAHLTGAAGIVNAVGLRDSKDPASPVLTFTPNQWATFVAGVRDSMFNS